MFFSTFTENLPRVGERVRVRGSMTHDAPYEVMDRLRDKSSGQVFFDCVYGGRTERFQAEVLSFWPAVGDSVLIIMGPYMDWLAAQLNTAEGSIHDGRLQQIEARFKACQLAGKTVEQLSQTHILGKAKGNDVSAMGAVSWAGKEFLCPLKCLAVLHKKDRRSDSEFNQLEQMKQLDLLGDAA